MSVLELSGAPLLVVYVLLALAAVIAAVRLRRTLQREAGTGWEGGRLDAYELACLASGPAGPPAAAVAGMIQAGTLRYDRKAGLVAAGDALPREAHPVERAVHAAAGDGQAIPEVCAEAATHCAGLPARLERRGLLFSEALARRAVHLPTGIMLLPVLLGTIKIAIDLFTTGRSTPGLFALMLANVVGAMVFLARDTTRTEAGDRALERRRGDHPNLRQRLGAAGASAAPADVALAVALFGPAALAGTPLAELRGALQLAIGRERGGPDDHGSGAVDDLGGGD